jgi:DNA-binding CsgD family transcriptional regulator
MDADPQRVESRGVRRGGALTKALPATSTTEGGRNVNGLNAAVVNHYAPQGGEVISLDKARAKRELVERTSCLSERELSVLERLAHGEATEEIAGTMYLSAHTVRSHVKSAMRKLDARTRAHAVAIALGAGVIDAV